MHSHQLLFLYCAVLKHNIGQCTTITESISTYTFNICSDCNFVRLGQLLKARLAIEVTVSGITNSPDLLLGYKIIDVFSLLSNAPSKLEYFSLSADTVIFSSFVALLNAVAEIVVQFLPIDTLLSELQFSNVLLSILSHYRELQYSVNYRNYKKRMHLLFPLLNKV